MDIEAIERMPDDWMADWLREREATVGNPDGSNSVHREQVIHARRGETHYEETTDMGDAELYDHEPLGIVGLGVTPVGKMREYADTMRSQKNFADEVGLWVPSGKELMERWGQDVTERWDAAHHRTRFAQTLVPGRN